MSEESKFAEQLQESLQVAEAGSMLERDILAQAFKRLLEERDALFEAAEAIDEWLSEVVKYEDNVPYVYGVYDSSIDRLGAKLRAAIALVEGRK